MKIVRDTRGRPVYPMKIVRDTRGRPVYPMKIVRTHAAGLCTP